MKLIVGLGNPEEKYQYTRHNIGFMVIEKLAKDMLPVAKMDRAWVSERRYPAKICKVKDNLLLVKPMAYMNRSGLAVVQIINFYKNINPADMWIIHDDIDLPIGKIRIRKGGGSAGHNGIDSIIRSLNFSDFYRFRLGIGRGKLDLQKTSDINLHRREVEKFVISPFTDHEAGEVKKLIKKAVQAVDMGLRKGIEVAMNRFN